MMLISLPTLRSLCLFLITSPMVQILLPTDFSPNARHASLYAARLFGTEEVAYTALHTYLDADPSITSWAGMAEGLYKGAMDRMQEWLEELRSSGPFQGASVRGEVLYGPLPSVLHAFGREQEADLVVMGTLGQTGAGIWGSNAGSVVKHGKLPVLVVPDRAEAGSVGRILYADDQQGVEVSGTRMLLHIALRTRSEIVLAHVLQEPDEVPDPEVVAMYEELLQAIPHRFIAEEGKDVAAAIDLLAEKENAGMIAVLHRNAGFLESLFRRSTAKRLALHTNTPLLVLQDLDGRSGS